MSETNVEIARKGYQAALDGDLEYLGGLLDENVKWHGGDDASGEWGCQNRKQALSWMRRAQFASRARGELVDVLGAGEKVVVIVRPRGENGELGEPVANLTTFRDGKVVRMVHYPNPDDALAAAGV